MPRTFLTGADLILPGRVVSGYTVVIEGDELHPGGLFRLLGWPFLPPVVVHDQVRVEDPHSAVGGAVVVMFQAQCSVVLRPVNAPAGSHFVPVPGPRPHAVDGPRVSPCQDRVERPFSMV